MLIPRRIDYNATFFRDDVTPPVDSQIRVLEGKIGKLEIDIASSRDLGERIATAERTANAAERTANAAERTANTAQITADNAQTAHQNRHLRYTDNFGALKKVVRCFVLCLVSSGF